MIASKTARSVAALVIGAAAFALAGCSSVTEGLNEKSNGHVKTLDYATGTVGKSDQEARLPSWVPDQARSVSEAIRTTGLERILRFTLDDPKVLTVCRPAVASGTPATLTALWWPSGQEFKTDKLCDPDCYVLVQGTTVYAYRPETTPNPPPDWAPVTSPERGRHTSRRCGCVCNSAWICWLVGQGRRHW
jgi:hypothetical protein